MDHDRNARALTFATLSLLALAGAEPGFAHKAGSDARIASVHARNAAELVAAMVKANETARPTIIRLAPGTYEFDTSFPAGELHTLLPTVTTAVAVVGRDPTRTVFRTHETRGRFFTVRSGGTLLILGVTLTGAFDFCDTECPAEKLGGGAVANFGGDVWIENSVLSGNRIPIMDNVDATWGGAIMTTGGHLSIDRTQVINNSALSGGALAILGGQVTLRRSLVSGNVSRQGAGEVGGTRAGGIYVRAGATLLVEDSTLSGNTATLNFDPDFGGFGGGLLNEGTVRIRDSAVTENVVTNYGDGGGILNGGRMTIESTTIAGNSGATRGGGIFNGGTLHMHNVTVAHNEATGSGSSDAHYPPGCEPDEREKCFSGGDGIWNEPGASLVMSGTVIGSNGTREDCRGTLLSEGNNALSAISKCTLQPAPSLGSRQPQDLLNIDVRLGELEDNGQPGEAHVPLLADSPLIDAGAHAGRRCPARDQLGHRRKDGDGDGDVRCDIGSVEFRAPPAR